MNDPYEQDALDVICARQVLADHEYALEIDRAKSIGMLVSDFQGSLVGAMLRTSILSNVYTVQREQNGVLYFTEDDEICAYRSRIGHWTVIGF